MNDLKTYSVSPMRKVIKATVLLVIVFSLSACVGKVVGAVVDTTIEVAKIPFKIVGAGIDLATDDSDSKSKKNDKKADTEDED